MRTRPRIILSLNLGVLAAATVNASLAVAQSAAEPYLVANPADYHAKTVRVGLGVGGGTVGQNGIGFRGAVTVSRKGGTALTVRAASVDEFNIFGPTPSESVWDVGILYGSQVNGRWAYVQVAGGLALVGGMRRGERISSTRQCEDLVSCIGAWLEGVEYAKEPFHTVGVPVEVEAGLNLTSRFGISAAVFGDLNPERSVAGASVGLVVGRLR